MGYDVVLSGEYYIDLIFMGLSEVPFLGGEVQAQSFALRPGASFTTARALTRLGLRTGWYCETGSDEFSARLLAACAEEGIDTALMPRRAAPRPRVTAAFAVAGDRGFLSHVSGEETLPPVEAVQGARFLLVNGLTCREGLAVLFAQAKALGVMTLLDPQQSSLSADALAPVLAVTDVLLPNEPEALALTGTRELRAAGKALAAHGPRVVVKRGRMGAALFEGSGEPYLLPAPLVPVVDATGAGDAFNAGYLYGLAKGHAPRAALRAAVLMGSAAVQGPGGAIMPDAAQLDTALMEGAGTTDFLSPPPLTLKESAHETS